MPSPSWGAEGKERTFSFYPKRADGQTACFPGNAGPFLNGEFPVRPILLPFESECLELRIYVRLSSPLQNTYEQF